MNEYTISLIHISDMHWCYTASDIRDKLGVIDDKYNLAKTHFQFTTELSRAASNCAAESQRTILVLNGDNISKGNFKDFEDTLLTELLLPTISLRFKGKAVFSSVVAVPGNHDKSSGNFNDYISFLAKLESRCFDSRIHFFSPFSKKPLYRFMCKERPVAIWAANSADKSLSLDAIEGELKQLRSHIQTLCAMKSKAKSTREIISQLTNCLNANRSGKKENYLNPGSITDEAMMICEQELRSGEVDLPGTRRLFGKDLPDALRIAILHHNSVPTVNDEGQKYGFLNASRFNHFLLDNRIRIVLHGHQHRGEVAAYTKFTSSLNAEYPYSSYLADGFLAIGAPAFDISQNRDERGFNIIQIRMSETHDVCEVKVDRRIWNKTLGKLESRISSHDIALRPPSSKDRAKALRDLTRLVYSNSSLRGIGRAIDSPDYLQNHADSLRSALGSMENVKAIYAVSVFAPINWLHNKLIELLMPLAQRNIAKAAVTFGDKRKIKVMSQGTGLAFRFSKPLCHAIATATRNAALVSFSQSINVAAKLKDEGCLQGSDFIGRCYHVPSAGPKSMSMFGRKGLTKPTRIENSDRLILVEEMACRPHFNYGGNRRRELTAVNRLFEFPRIVLWEPSDFLRPSALDIIEFHEFSGFPLFWMDPELLINKKGERRKKVGYVSIIAPKHDKVEVQTAKELLHEPDGRKLQHEPNVAEHVWGGAGPRLWKINKGKMGIAHDEFNGLGGHSKGLHEFIWLLGHPCLCFAADAWYAKVSGEKTWKRFTDSLRRML